MMSVKRVTLQPAYVLHKRPYRETSFLVEIITQDHGRLTVIARGVRKPRSATQGLLQAFKPLFMSWVGKTELMTMTQLELRGEAPVIQGECLYAGFYLHELMIALLARGDPHPGVFQAYEKALDALQSTPLEQKTLRIFEKYLLEDLGYGLLLKSDHTVVKRFEADKYYRLVADQGFILTELPNLGEDAHAASLSPVFLGRNLLAMAKEDWRDEGVLQDAKRLNRFILSPLLGSRPLHSRRLFMPFNERKKHVE
ncbi:MAG: DNA repair protein RecO [Gammaproteobacteria bacterium RIFCSPHIGHO2_12_FULL_45_12]|nr:MAG: DNA repair protein RecO [Gammaproteobacteria bacterium RIFCSPHIGHO2_12_FULL_45_12]